MASLYHDLLFDHYKHPRNVLPIAGSDFTATVVNATCGDRVFVVGTVVDGVVAELQCLATGCVISVAAASLLSQQVLGKPVSSVLAMDPSVVLSLIKLELGPMRLRCALLGLEAIKKALHVYTCGDNKCSTDPSY